MDKTLQFAYAAINDCQATIRAIDVKLGMLLTAVFLPLSVINKIWSVFELYTQHFSKCIPNIIVILFFVLWGFIVISLINVLAAIDNPKDHINSADDCTGAFYNGGQFNFALKDLFFSNKDILSRSQVAEIADRYPTDEKIIKELSFEHLKLSYIRDIKLHRFKYCIYATVCWGVTGLGIFISTRSF